MKVVIEKDNVKFFHLMVGDIVVDNYSTYIVSRELQYEGYVEGEVKYNYFLMGLEGLCKIYGGLEKSLESLYEIVKSADAKIYSKGEYELKLVKKTSN